MEKVNGLRDTTNDLDNVTIIEDKYDKIKENQAEILKEKEGIRSTDIGSFRFIAESFEMFSRPSCKMVYYCNCFGI